MPAAGIGHPLASKPSSRVFCPACRHRLLSGGRRRVIPRPAAQYAGSGRSRRMIALHARRTARAPAGRRPGKPAVRVRPPAGAGCIFGQPAWRPGRPGAVARRATGQLHARARPRAWTRWTQAGRRPRAVRQGRRRRLRHAGHAGPHRREQEATAGAIATRNPLPPPERGQTRTRSTSAGNARSRPRRMWHERRSSGDGPAELPVAHLPEEQRLRGRPGAARGRCRQAPHHLPRRRRPRSGAPTCMYCVPNLARAAGSSNGGRGVRYDWPSAPPFFHSDRAPPTAAEAFVTTGQIRRGRPGAFPRAPLGRALPRLPIA